MWADINIKQTHGEANKRVHPVYGRIKTRFHTAEPLRSVHVCQWSVCVQYKHSHMLVSQELEIPEVLLLEMSWQRPLKKERIWGGGVWHIFIWE